MLDPRETFLRRSRAAPIPNLRSSPARAPSEVWTGKGLVSWALDEPGAGKNLITGRLVRRAEFAAAAPVPEGMSALEALVAANAAARDGHEAWGIEIAVGLKSSISSTVGYPGPLHQSVENGSVTGHRSQQRDTPRQPSFTHREPSFSRADSRPLQRITSTGVPRIHPTPTRPTPAPVPAAAASSSSKPPPPPPKAAEKPAPKRGRKKAVERTLSSVDTNSLAATLPKPENITKERAQELLKDSSFLTMLEQLTGAPISALAAEKRAAQESPEEEPVHKRGRFESAGDNKELCCSNCGTNKSSVWRQKKSDDGQSMRVCNACGLYYNKTRTMRPKTLWADSDEGPKRGSSSKAGFKRTLTQVVEKDAQRIASMRKPRAPRQIKPVPMTSPARGPAPKTVRNGKFAASTAVAASSPGGWVASTPASSGPAALPSETPNTALRRILGESMPSLAMPLSDDAAGEAPPNQMTWNADLSTFFDVDGFAMTPGNADDAAVKVEPSSATRSTFDRRGVSSAVGHDGGSKEGKEDKEDKEDGDDIEKRPASSEDDDVFSQLFQRTSSAGDLSSTSSPFDFSQLPPSSPPALPSNLPHSALLLSSPSSSPNGVSPRTESDFGKPSPALSSLRNEVGVDENKPEGEQVFHDLLHKLANGNMGDELLALFNSFPAASPA